MKVGFATIASAKWIKNILGKSKMTMPNFARPGLVAYHMANATQPRSKRKARLGLSFKILAGALLTLAIGLAAWNVGG